MRQRNPDRYAGELQWIGTAPGVRLHLKDMVVCWRGQGDPLPSEWAVIESVLRDSDSPLVSRALQLLRVPSWFDAADESGLIAEWLAIDDNRADTATWVLGQVDRARPQRVARLLRPY